MIRLSFTGTQFVLDYGPGTGNIDGINTPYAGGDVYLNGSDLSGYSFAFQTFVDTSITSITPAPEPGSITLLAVAATGLVGIIRKRRKQGGVAPR